MKNKIKGIIILVVLVLLNTVLSCINLITYKAKFFNTFMWGFLSAVIVVVAIMISLRDENVSD